MTFEGREEIRRFAEDWLGSFEDYQAEAEEVHDLGNGVTWGVLAQRGRPRGTSSFIKFRIALVHSWANGLIERARSYADIDEARAAAERLAEETG